MDINQTLLSLHTLLMCTGFGLFTPAAVYFARYERTNRQYDWFQLHLNFQLIGFLCQILGAICAFYVSDLQFRTFHGVVGIAVIVLSGVILPHYGFPEPSEDMNRAYYLHAQMGNISLHGCLLTVALGLLHVGASSFSWGFFAAVSIFWYIILFNPRFTARIRRKLYLSIFFQAHQ